MTTVLLNLLAEASCTKIDDDTRHTIKYCTNLPNPAASSDNLQAIVHIVFAILAVVAILMIVIAALNIVTANGDSGKVAKARGTIIYALVGLVVAISADVIVSLIIGRL